jgi:hypothetical protein
MLVEKNDFVAFEENYMTAMIGAAAFTPCATETFTSTDDFFYFRKISDIIDIRSFVFLFHVRNFF